MSAVSFDSAGKWDARVPLLIIGAGPAGICAALAEKEAGVEAVVIEALSTALSAGLIRAAGTRFQRAEGVADSPERFAADIHPAFLLPDRDRAAIGSPALLTPDASVKSNSTPPATFARL